jgi:hypothetical protein
MNRITKRILICFFIIFNFSLSFSQEIYTEIQGKKIGYFVNIEKKIKSELFDTNQTYLSFDDSAQPIIYKRKEVNIPDLLVQYSFSKKDSIINEVLYEWDVYNFDKNDNNIKSEKFNKALIKKYNDLLKDLTNKYGKSVVKGSLDDLNQIESDKGLSREDNWKPNDSLEIKMYTSISNYYKKEGAVSTNPRHRIRLYIKNIKKKVEPKLDEKTITIANQNFEDFMTQLKAGDFIKLKLSISDIAAKNVTDAQLEGLKKMINFDTKLIPYFKGFQMTMKGENYLMIKYKYENDPNEVPITLVSVIFDKENKILGVQPMTRKKVD